ncbi:MAG: hypothetical protein IJN03_02590 [Bacilli bacterium]|nr:hypothetical protein [Bacilli bacterium]
MKKKLLIIVIIGVIATIGIYYLTINNKVKLLTLGDGLASGMTAYNVNGYSYSDYLKDYYKSKNNLENYNNVFAEANLTSNELLENIKKNKNANLNGKTITIQQAIKDANVIIIAIGIDELANKSLNNKITTKDLSGYYSSLTELLSYIRKINSQKVILLGIYDAYNIKDINAINGNLAKIASKQNADFLDISKVINSDEYFFNDTSYYLNYKGHKKVNEELIKII